MGLFGATDSPSGDWSIVEAIKITAHSNFCQSETVIANLAWVLAPRLQIGRVIEIYYSRITAQEQTR